MLLLISLNLTMALQPNFPLAAEVLVNFIRGLSIKRIEKMHQNSG